MQYLEVQISMFSDNVEFLRGKKDELSDLKAEAEEKNEDM